MVTGKLTPPAKLKAGAVGRDSAARTTWDPWRARWGLPPLSPRAVPPDLLSSRANCFRFAAHRRPPPPELGKQQPLRGLGNLGLSQGAEEAFQLVELGRVHAHRVNGRARPLRTYCPRFNSSSGNSWVTLRQRRQEPVQPKAPKPQILRSLNGAQGRNRTTDTVIFSHGSSRTGGGESAPDEALTYLSDAA